MGPSSGSSTRSSWGLRPEFHGQAWFANTGDSYLRCICFMNLYCVYIYIFMCVYCVYIYIHMYIYIWTNYIHDYMCVCIVKKKNVVWFTVWKFFGFGRLAVWQSSILARSNMSSDTGSTMYANVNEKRNAPKLILIVIVVVIVTYCYYILFVVLLWWWWLWLWWWSRVWMA
jgi:hypothetical protein